MGFLRGMFGEREEPEYRRHEMRGYDHGRSRRSLTDEQALERYRYMLRTAPPETIEQAHEEAFAKLTPEQRRMALEELARVVPPSERAYLNDDPRSLARAATRTELRQPGTIINVFGGTGGGYGMGGFGMGGMGMGGMFAGTLLGSLVGSFIGSAIANEFFDNDMTFIENDYGGEGLDGEVGPPADEFGAGDPGADFGGDDFGGGDLGGADCGGGGEF